MIVECACLYLLLARTNPAPMIIVARLLHKNERVLNYRWRIKNESNLEQHGDCGKRRHNHH